MRIRAWQTKIGSYGSIFALKHHPRPVKNPKHQNFEKKKTLLEISFYTCTKNHNHMRYGFWDRVRQTDFFVLLGHFLPFYPLTTQKIKILKKYKKHMKMSSIDICVPKITIIWCMLPEIWVQPHNFRPFWVIFCLFTQLLAPKTKNWKKRRYFLFRMRSINKGSWDIRHKQRNFSFWAIFCSFIPLTNQKIKILKKWKKTREILSFYICLPWMAIIWCTVPEIWSSRGKIFSDFGLFFALLLKNHNFERKKTLEISSAYTCVPQMAIIWCMVP